MARILVSPLLALGMSFSHLAPVDAALAEGTLTLWYDQPAKSGMNEALPIGNGRFGALLYGGPTQERVVLNEISLWTGSEVSSDDYGKMGSYQMLGELFIDQASDKPTAKAQGYRRSLDLASAAHDIRYQADGVTYRREAFASHADQVLVVRIAADSPGRCRGVVRLAGAHQETTRASGNSLAFSGSLANGLKYATKLVVLNDGGSLQAQDGKIEFNNANSLTLLLAAGTDYVADYARQYRGSDPGPVVEQRLASAAAKKYDDLKAAHVAD